MKKLKHYFNYTIWETEDVSKSWLTRLFHRLMRIITITSREYLNDRIYLRASALSFYSVLSVVPVLALAFGVANGFGLENLLEAKLRSAFEGQETILKYSLEFADRYLKTSHGGWIAGISIFVLFYTLMMLLANIEEAFNDIWNIKKSRILIRKFTDYLAIVLLAPTIIIISSIVNFTSTYMLKISSDIDALSFLTPLITRSFSYIPLALTTILFTLVYLVMPNTIVKFKPSVFAGVFAGLGYHILQYFYISSQLYVSRYNAIYGSFAALPLFLLWLQVSWLIILIGAKLAYSIQNQRDYPYFPGKSHLSHKHIKLLAVTCLYLINKRYLDNKEPYSKDELRSILGTPIFIIDEIIEDLVKCELLAKLTNNQSIPRYIPLKAPYTLDFAGVLKAIDVMGEKDLPIYQKPLVKQVNEMLEKFNNSISKLPENIAIVDLTSEEADISNTGQIKESQNKT